MLEGFYTQLVNHNWLSQLEVGINWVQLSSLIAMVLSMYCYPDTTHVHPAICKNEHPFI